jgi:hypothetical protein
MNLTTELFYKLILAGLIMFASLYAAAVSPEPEPTWEACKFPCVELVWDYKK